MDKSTKICFVSIGANGSAIAADMIAAGIEMSCFDPWPSHVEAIQKEGLLIKLPDEHKIQSIPIYHLCQLAESSHPFDIIFMASKSYDTKWIVELIKPHLAVDGILVSLQNGMTTNDIAQIITEERVLSCVVELSCELFIPGQIQRNTPKNKTWFAIENKNTQYLDTIFRMLRNAGTVVKVDDIQSAKWIKLLVNSMSLGPFAILCRPVQEGLRTKGMRDLILKIGEVTGPRTSIFFNDNKFFFIFCASKNPSSSFFDEIINAINLTKGGSFFSFRRQISSSRNLFGSFSIIFFNVSSDGLKV